MARHFSIIYRVMNSCKKKTVVSRISNLGSGFTLAELIVVITVLAILATVGFVALSGHLSSARDSSRSTEVGQVSRAVELSAVQNGKYPMPVAAEGVALVSFTGGVSGNAVVTQWAATAANVRDLGGSFGKKKQTGPFVYSVLADGAAYQVAAEFENGVSKSREGFPEGTLEAYASSKTAYVEGTYRADPSLPSLVISSGSVTGTGLFSPDACFVTQGGANLPSTSAGCKPKKSLELKSLDSGLVGYWDMETLCVSGSCGAGNDGKLADLSGNSFHAYATGSSVMPIINQALMGKWGTMNGGLVIWDDLTFPWEKELSIESLVKTTGYANPYPRIVANRHFNTCVMDCYAFKDHPTYSGACLWVNYPNQWINAFWAQILSITGGTLNWNYWSALRGITGVGTAKSFTDSRKSWTVTVGQYWHMVMTFDGKDMLFYVNGILVDKTTWWDGFLFQKDWTDVVTKDILIGWVGRTNATRNFSGVIDEVKIYSRILTKEEIAQRAKTAGF